MDVSPQVLVGVVTGGATGLVALGGYFRATVANERELTRLRNRLHETIRLLGRVHERASTLSLLLGLPPVADLEAPGPLLPPRSARPWWQRLLLPRERQ